MGEGTKSVEHYTAALIWSTTQKQSDVVLRNTGKKKKTFPDESVVAPNTFKKYILEQGRRTQADGQEDTKDTTKP